jgi:hypothetical protein
MHPPAPRATSCPRRTPRPATSDPRDEAVTAQQPSVEVVATVLLALAAVATAWSGYQASRRHGLVTFSQWVDAYAGRAAAEARRDIQQGVRCWLAPSRGRDLPDQQLDLGQEGGPELHERVHQDGRR